MQGNKQLDIGSFTLYDSNAIEPTENKQQLQDKILQRTIQNVQYVFKQIIQIKKQQIAAVQSLPQQEQIHDFNVTKLHMKLPEPGIMFPRSRKLPQQKSMTKWQRFAKEKGIKKRKRGAFSYDNDHKQYVSRWGSKSAKNKFQLPIMQEKQFNRNPFQDTKNKKKLRVQKQRLRQLKNQQRGNNRK